jgi:hypothetical protein
MSQGIGARTVEENTIGHVSDLLVQTDIEREGSLQAQVVTLVEQTRLLLDAVNGRLSLGDGRQSSRTGNLDGVNIQYNFTDVSTVEAIPHNLGRKPSGWKIVEVHYSAIGTDPPPSIISCGSDGDVLYGGGENRIDGGLSDWDNRLIYLRAEGNADWLPALYRIQLF